MERADVTPAVPGPTVQIPVDHHSAVQVAADRARTLARECGLPGALPDHAAVLASELATNIDKHARDGAIYLQPSPAGTGWTSSRWTGDPVSRTSR